MHGEGDCRYDQGLEHDGARVGRCAHVSSCENHATGDYVGKRGAVKRRVAEAFGGATSQDEGGAAEEWEGEAKREEMPDVDATKACNEGEEFEDGGPGCVGEVAVGGGGCGAEGQRVECGHNCGQGVDPSDEEEGDAKHHRRGDGSAADGLQRAGDG